MTYIINPMWFYWLSVVDKACELALTAVILLVILSAALFIAAAFCKVDEECFEYKTGVKMQKIATAAIAVAAILFIICVFVPSKETLIEMQIARFTTVENAELVLDAIKSATDYIVLAIKELG